MTPHGKHRPKSHPALRRLTVLDQSLDPEQSAVLADCLDEMAALLAKMPEFPPTMTQRQRFRIIAKELLRRADGW